MPQEIDRIDSDEDKEYLAELQMIILIIPLMVVLIILVFLVVRPSTWILGKFEVPTDEIEEEIEE